METSVSRKCLRRKIVQMLERSRSLLQYYNNIANLQDWYSADRGFHTPRQDEGDEPMMELVTGLQTRCEYRAGYTHRDLETRAQKQLSTLIVNVETDVQAE